MSISDVSVRGWAATSRGSTHAFKSNPNGEHQPCRVAAAPKQLIPRNRRLAVAGHRRPSHPALDAHACRGRVPQGLGLRGGRSGRRPGRSPRGPCQDRLVLPRRLQPPSLPLPSVALAAPALPPPVPPHRRLAHLLALLPLRVLPGLRAPAPTPRPRHVLGPPRRRPALLTPPLHAAVPRTARARPRLQARPLLVSLFRLVPYYSILPSPLPRVRPPPVR